MLYINQDDCDYRQVPCGPVFFDALFGRSPSGRAFVNGASKLSPPFGLQSLTRGSGVSTPDSARQAPDLALHVGSRTEPEKG